MTEALGAFVAFPETSWEVPDISFYLSDKSRKISGNVLRAPGLFCALRGAPGSFRSLINLPETFQKLPKLSLAFRTRRSGSRRTLFTFSGDVPEAPQPLLVELPGRVPLG